MSVAKNNSITPKELTALHERGLGGDFRNSAEWPRRRRAATGRMIWNA